MSVGNIKFKRDEVSELEDLMINRNDKKNILSFEEMSINSSCSICNQKSVYVFITKVRDYLKEGLCKDCVMDVMEEVKNKKKIADDMEIHVDDSGYSIVDWSGAERTRRDSIEDTRIRKNVVIVINTHKNEIVTRIRNIEKLISMLDSNNVKDDFIFNCEICREDTKVGFVDDFLLCRKCANEISSSLQKYSDKNREFIMSRII